MESPEMTTGIVNGKEKPTVLTDSTNSLHSDGTLVFQGEIQSPGKSDITETGFYWSSASNDPNTKDNTVIISVADVFNYELQDVSGEKTFYWRAYAKNSYGYDYGKVQSFKTPAIWERKDSLTAYNRGKGVVFSVNDKIYITCGELEWGHIPANNTWEYNITENNWKEVLPFPSDGRINPVYFTIGNTAFIGTGLTPQLVARKDFYLFNPAIASKVWTEITTPDNFDARYEAIAFSLNGKGYVIGGLSTDRKALSDVWQYDPENNLWKKINNFPVNFYGGISISGNNRVFAGFGETEESQKTLWEYNEEADHWTEFAFLPKEINTKIYSGVIVKKTIYIVDEKNTIWTLNTEDDTKTWNKKTTLPSIFFNENGEGGFQSLLTKNKSNSIFVGLGFSNQLYEYRPLWDN